MNTITNRQIDAILVSSAGLDWADPKAVKAEIRQVEGMNKFANVWQAADGQDRVYGCVGGHVRGLPVMAANKAKIVLDYLLRS